MPNWCANNVVIEGPKDVIKSLWETAQKGEGLLSAMRPEPNYEKEVVLPTFPEVHGNNDPVDPSRSWWDWRVQNWGTKWDVEIAELTLVEESDTASITGWFESAWSPPVDAFAYYSDQHPEVSLSLMYHESGMAFVGKWTNDGIDESITYSEYSSENIREAIGEELDDAFGITEMLAQYEEDEA